MVDLKWIVNYASANHKNFSKRYTRKRQTQAVFRAEIVKSLDADAKYGNGVFYSASMTGDGKREPFRHQWLALSPKEKKTLVARYAESHFAQYFDAWKRKRRAIRARRRSR